MTGPDPRYQHANQAFQVTVPLWDELVAAALLGTERRPFEAPTAPGPLGELVAGPSLSLADAAAATWAYMEAGRRAPLAGGSSRAPAPSDDRPALPRGAVRALSAILRDPRLRVLLDEWLELAVGDGRRLPGRLLPDLLDAVHGDGPAAAAAVEAVAGPRASWLAAQNPAWQRPDAVPPGSTERLLAHLRDPGRADTGPGPVWSGSDQARTSLFVAVRSADADAGRRLAGLVWADEPGTTRAAIVAGLASGLSMADEPWLEDRLDDRRRDVREAAADLLRRLPDSRLAGRMAARVRSTVTRSGSPPALVVTPPPEPDRDARRDGVGPPGDSDEAVAARLEALIGATPLTVWDEEAGEGSGPDLVEWAVRAAGPLDGRPHGRLDGALDGPLGGALLSG